MVVISRSLNLVYREVTQFTRYNRSSRESTTSC